MITEEEIDSLAEEECVMDLKNTLAIAFEKYREWKEEEQ